MIFSRPCWGPIGPVSAWRQRFCREKRSSNTAAELWKFLTAGNSKVPPANATKSFGNSMAFFSFPEKPKVQARLATFRFAGAIRGFRAGEIQEHHIREALHSVEYNFTCVWRDVEVANVEVCSEVGQLALLPRLQVDQPEILVLNLSAQEHQRSSSRKDGEVSSPASEGKSRQRTHYGVGCNGFQRKGRADVGSRVDNEVAVGRPRRINGVLRKKKSWWLTVERHSKEGRDAVIIRSRGERLSVGRPCRRSLQVQRIADNARVGAVRLHDIQRGLPMLADRECDVPSVGGDCRPAKDLLSLSVPQFRSHSIGELPYTFAGAGRRNIQKIVSAHTWREPAIARERDSRRRRHLCRRISTPQTAESSFRSCQRGHHTATVSASG